MPDRMCSRGHSGKAVDGVCPICWRIMREEPYPKDVTPTILEPTLDDHGATIHPDKEQ